MNWKDVPHLFAFNFDVEFLAVSGRKRMPIGGLRLNDIKADPGKYTLVARMIEDMTDEEYEELFEYSHSDFSREENIENLKELCDCGKIWLEDVEKLSKWGIYFGPQSHFKDGTVINAKEESECK